MKDGYLEKIQLWGCDIKQGFEWKSNTSNKKTYVKNVSEETARVKALR